MGINFCRGDIFETEENIALAHGCNCAGAMGKGIAVAFKDRWPEMYQTYKGQCATGEFSPGDVFVWRDPDSDRIIFNLGTQRTWRTKALIEDIETSVENMLQRASELEVTYIAMPLIGAGLGRLPDEKVKEVLVAHSRIFPIQLIVCEQYEQGKQPV